MYWEMNSDKKFYVPRLTQNKELKDYIKLCCLSRRDMLLNYEIFRPFPEKSKHYVIMSTFKSFADQNGAKKEWTEFQILNMLGNWVVDGIEAKVKSNESLQFKYYRSELKIPSSISNLWKEEPYYINSKMLDWEKLTSEFKMFIISKI